MSNALTSEHYEAQNKVRLGFWTYLMTDCVLFASVFATYAVLRNNTFGGPSGHELFNLKFVLTETLILLISSYTCGIALLSAKRGDKRAVIIFLAATFLLGATFLGMELNEFHKLVEEGNSWRRSGFLSAFFTLVGMHGAHIATGLIWLAVTVRKIAIKGLTPVSIQRLTLFSVFWHFLDVIWIFIFTIVYLMGAA